MFNKAKYLTRGVDAEVPMELQFFMWECIHDLKLPKDYLQIFHLSVSDGKQLVVHEQEEPEYKKEYRLEIGSPINNKVYVIDDGDYSTMLLAEEY